MSPKPARTSIAYSPADIERLSYFIAVPVQILMHHPNEGDHEFLFIIGHALPGFA
jgi:hypothetical protein